MARYLFVHQNFPGQFMHVAKALAERGDQVVAIGESKRLQKRGKPHPSITLLGYAEPKGAGRQTHHYLRSLEAHVRRGQAAFRAAFGLANKGYRPDVVVSHPGWGESLFLKDAFPTARHVHYCEYFYRATGGDVGFDPAFPTTVDDVCRVRVKTATQLIGLEYADAGISPTAWQRSTYPKIWQPAITQIHEGIDTAVAKPERGVKVHIERSVGASGLQALARAGSTNVLTLGEDDEVLTYVARNLEPYRGFHVFMQAVPLLLELRPRLRILVVGGDDVSYGKSPPGDSCFREHYQQSWPADVDRSRVHFLGKLAYADYLNVLRISSLHVYLTYPFVLSWSLLEAMSCGCAVLASDTAPVREVIRDGENGWLTDFFDHARLATRAAQLLEARREHASIRAAARAHVVDRYDLHQHCLPATLAFLTPR